MSKNPSEEHATPKRKKVKWGERLSRFSKNLALVVAIVTGLSTLIGLAWNIYENAQATRDERYDEQIAELTTYADFGEMVKEYRVIGRRTAEFMKAHRHTKWNCDSLLDLYEAGVSIYYSKDLEDWTSLREFYEDLGLLIRYDVLDFDLVYELIIFPTECIELTAPLTDCLSENWYGPGKPLYGLSSNLHQLHLNYERKRKGEKVVWETPD